jgi:polysaccharide biosynthesis protein PelE
VELPKLTGKKSNTVIAVLLELLSWVILNSSQTDGWIFIEFIFVHSVACYFFTQALLQMLPEKYSFNKSNLYLFFFSLCFFIPYLGAMGLYSGWLAGLNWPKKITAEIYDLTKEPPLPYHPLIISEKTIYGQAGLAGVVKNAASPDKRLKAIMATRQLDDKDAVPILRLALKDRVDDVRLLAYSMLDTKEEKLNSGIQKIEKILLKAKGSTKARLHKEIAHHYWELSYLGLAQGDVMKHVLNQSCDNLGVAIDLEPDDAGSCFESGRVLLRLGRQKEAMERFTEAMKYGISANDVLPYMAEAAFNMKNYKHVKLLLNKLPEEARKIPSLNKITNFWSLT